MWRVEGQLSFTGSGQPFDGEFTIDTGLESNLWTLSYGKDDFPGLSDSTIDLDYYPWVEFDIYPNTWNSFSPMLRVSLTPWEGMTSHVANLGSTMTLFSLTFTDGSTPESHGWAVDFASGARSPNQNPNVNPNPVPEPSGIVLCVSGGVLLGAVLLLRRARGRDKAALIAA